MGELVGDDSRQLLVVESVDQAACNHHDGVTLPDPAGEGVQRHRFDHAHIGGRKASCDGHRFDNVAQPRLVVMVDEVEGHGHSHPADVPCHLEGEDCGRDQSHDRNVPHRVAAPVQEWRVPFVETCEGQIQSERRRQLQGQNEAAEECGRASVVDLDPAEQSVDREHGRLRT